MQLLFTAFFPAFLINITCGSSLKVNMAECLSPSIALKKYLLATLFCGTWQSLQLVTSRWLLCCHVAYWGAIIWQLTQVSGLSPKYECAFESFRTNKPKPQNTPSRIITGSCHLSGGMKAFINLLIFDIFLGLLIEFDFL